MIDSATESTGRPESSRAALASCWCRFCICPGDTDNAEVLDAALAAAAQAVEHYEITRCGSLIAWARELGRSDCADVLEQTLTEEKAADAKLTKLAESRLNRNAA